MKTAIDNRYVPTEEIRSDLRPYEDYFDVLKCVFAFGREVRSVCDLGCANGPLLQCIRAHSPDLPLLGVEYFDWQRQAAHASVRDGIVVHDLRDPFPVEKKFDLVNCTEVAEHVDPAYCDVLFDNAIALTKRYLITSWASSGGVHDPEHDPHCQHLNPKSPRDYVDYMHGRGLRLDRDLTDRMVAASLGREHFYPWWRESLAVWRV